MTAFNDWSYEVGLSVYYKIPHPEQSNIYLTFNIYNKTYNMLRKKIKYFKI